MKKAISIFVLLATTLSLSSCAVNWFGDTMDVPWYYIAIPVALVAVLGYMILMSKTYICPHCQTEFKAKPHQFYVTIHYCGKRFAKCPNCKIKSFCKVKK